MKRTCILQEFNFEISYKPAESIVVCDSLSRARPIHSLDSAESNPNENDPYFPFVPEPVNKILPKGSSLQDVISTEQANQQKSVNPGLIPHAMLLDNDSAYEGDTYLPQVKCSDISLKFAVRGKIQRKFLKPSGKVQSRRLATESRLSEDLSESDNERDEQTSASNSDATNSENAILLRLKRIMRRYILLKLPNILTHHILNKQAHKKYSQWILN